MNKRGFSALARPMDLKYSTNRAILILMAAINVLFFFVHWASGVMAWEALVYAFQAGISVFLAWAIGRELDPDHGLTAFVSAALMLALLFLFPLPNLLALFWLLLLVRLLNRTVGLPPTLLDITSILGLTAWLCFQENWMYGLLTTMVFLQDQFVFKSAQKFAWPVVVASLITVVYLLIELAIVIPNMFIGILAAGGLTFTFFVLFSLKASDLKSVGDETGEPLLPKRMKAAQLSAAFIVLLFLLLEGDAAFAGFLPVWTAMLGTLLFTLWLFLKKSLAGSQLP